MLLLLALLLLIFLPSPWNLVVALGVAVLGAGEVLFFHRRMRGHKVRTGVENLVGAVGKAVEPLDPEGHVRVHGELWEARSTQPAKAGTPVRVLAVHGLELDVEPAAEEARAP